MEYYSLYEKRMKSDHGTTCMCLEGIMLNEINEINQKLNGYAAFQKPCLPGTKGQGSFSVENFNCEN